MIGPTTEIGKGDHSFRDFEFEGIPCYESKGADAIFQNLFYRYFETSQVQPSSPWSFRSCFRFPHNGRLNGFVDYDLCEDLAGTQGLERFPERS